MTIKKLRECLNARPFRQMKLRTTGGGEYRVRHPDYLLIPPVGDMILIVEEDGRFHLVDILYVESVEFAEAKPA
jgi:hypothetical protein